MTPITWYLYGRSGGAKKAAEEIGVKESVSGDIAVISDGADDVAVKSLVAEITPVQDLHGQANPYPAGGGVNKFVCGDAVGVSLSSGAAYGLTIVCNGEDETVTISGTPTWTSTGNRAFRVISTKAGSYYGDAPVTHDYAGFSGKWFVISKSSNISSIADAAAINSDGTIGITLTNTDTSDVNIVLKLCVYEGSTAPTAWSPYSNIRPISGRTGLTVTAAGKNLLNMPTYAEIQAASSVVGYKSIALNLTPNTTYYLSTTFINGYTANGKEMYILLTNSATTNEPWVAVAHSGNVNGKVNGVMTTGADGILYLRFNGATEDKLTELYANSEIQLEVGSAATAYEPYAGQTYPITWEAEAGTVYGGTLDVVSGVLTVTHAYWTKNTAMMNNNEDYPGWRASGIKAIIGEKNEVIPGVTGNVGTVIGTNTFSTNDIVYMPKAFYAQMTQTDWIAMALDMQFVLPLATPQTYQLTPTEVRTILGGNNIYTDAGAVSVEYVADTKLYIDNKIAELQALVLEN